MISSAFIAVLLRCHDTAIIYFAAYYDFATRAAL